MDLDPQSLNVICPIGPLREIRKIELNLIPPVVQPHRHRTNEGLDPRGGLIVRGPEASPDVFVIEDLDFKCKKLFKLRS